MIRVLVFFLVWAAPLANAQMLRLPARSAHALSGSAFAAVIDTLSLESREELVYREVVAGNIPEFLRRLTPVAVHIAAHDTVRAGTHTAVYETFHLATYYVTPDYLAIGSDADYLRMPMTPALAQRIADVLGCSLPTRKMVNDIYAAAPVQLRPQPIPPSAAMITVRLFRQHNDSVEALLNAQLPHNQRGALTAGQKKDVVITNTINNPAPLGRVAIYGWHRAVNDPIQPLYIKHKDTWADYSHGIRLVQQLMIVDGEEVLLGDVLKNVDLAPLLSDEGIILNARYPTSSVSIQSK